MSQGISSGIEHVKNTTQNLQNTVGNAIENVKDATTGVISGLRPEYVFKTKMI